MGYQISYDPDQNDKYRLPEQKKINKLLWKKVLCAVGISILGLVPFIRSWIWNFIVPGDPKITIPAISCFFEEIGRGERVSDALTFFCQEILQND